MTDILFSSWGGVVTDNRGKPEADRQPPPASIFPWNSTGRGRSRPLSAGTALPFGIPTPDIIDLIRAYLEAVQKESCGKCTPCRVGTRVMVTDHEPDCRWQRQGRRP